MKLLVNIKKLLVTFILLSNIATPTIAKDSFVGVGDNTRVVFDLSEKRISIPVYNQTDSYYLFHAQIIDHETGDYSRDFITNPEVVQLSPNRSKYVEIIRLADFKGLKTEKLFHLRGTFIPTASTKSEKSEFGMDVGYEIEMKLFVRPKALWVESDAIRTLLNKVKFKKSRDGLDVVNESPYYITFDKISINDRLIKIPDDVRMIEPFGKKVLKVNEVAVKTITWTLINDGGFPTEPKITEM